MNKHILLVMKWLNDKNSVTQEELESNRKSAGAAYVATYDAAAEKWVNKYFKLTGENEQEYIDALKSKINSKPVYTQTMVDEGILPNVGMECIVRESEISSFYKCKVEFKNEDIIFIKYTDKETNVEVYQHFGLKMGIVFKPLTPLIELVDGKAYQFELNEAKRSGLACKGMLITVGLSSGEAFHVELLKCTNIKELGVLK